MELRPERITELEIGSLYATVYESRNNYFDYVNPRLMYFSLRTRNGKTSCVVSVMPAVPEADPLYHSNLSFIDMQDVCSRVLCPKEVNNHR